MHGLASVVTYIIVIDLVLRSILMLVYVGFTCVELWECSEDTRCSQVYVLSIADSLVLWLDCMFLVYIKDSYLYFGTRFLEEIPSIS